MRYITEKMIKYKIKGTVTGLNDFFNLFGHLYEYHSE